MITSVTIQREIKRIACLLHKKRGIAPRKACKMAAQIVMRAVPPHRKYAKAAGIGQVSPELISTVHKTVSPWLWILSVGGFLMTTLNTSRVSRMFKKSTRIRRRQVA